MKIIYIIPLYAIIVVQRFVLYVVNLLREYPFTQETCSTKCGGILRKQRGSNKGSKTVICNVERICSICGESFIAKSSRRQICYKDHYHKCPVCGKDVLTTSIHDIDKCCSKECSRIKASKTYQSTISKNSEYILVVPNLMNRNR